LFARIVHPLMPTSNTSMAEMAPPQVEHGCKMESGQLLNPPFAELPEKEVLSTRRNKARPGPVTDIAPPFAALQLMKLHFDTWTLLPLADTAPPSEVGFKQFWKVMAEMVTEAFQISNAAPDAEALALQSKNVADGTPLISSDSKPLIFTVDSLKMPAVRLTRKALTLNPARA
jgi:hypothetical protein